MDRLDECTQHSAEWEVVASAVVGMVELGADPGVWQYQHMCCLSSRIAVCLGYGIAT